ncbi:MAG: branched-chain amino acid transport system ATP-binding protein livM [Actinomycetota bacterium]|jgi:ABC-type branched-subunit amino acid transport system ATPase component/ABC-type branched-subunit amino acid transport system permease subunit|nr:branched-chain amino acid transport system ATP-binding protein livM [Actinomycetota bacterium]
MTDDSMPPRHRRSIDVGLILLACIVLPPLTGWAMPDLLSKAHALTLTYGVTLGIAALSLNLLLGYAGQLSLGHAALLGVGAFAASVVVDRLGLPMFAGWVVGGLTGGVVALGIGIPALRLRGLYLALVTLVFGATLQASVLRWQFFTNGSSGASLPRRWWFGDHILINEPVYLSMCLVVLVGIWLLDINVLRTRLGRAFLAIREDETTAQSFGIDVVRYKLLAFVLSGVIAGVAGTLYGGAIGLVTSDEFGRELSLRIVLIVIIGGVGRRWGPVLISVLLAIAPTLPPPFRRYDLVIAAAITLFNVVKLPDGLAGFVAHRRAKPAGPPVDAEQLRGLDLGAVTGPPAVLHQQQLLVVESMSVAFGGLHAVEDVSVTVEAGQIVGIIGPNGAGKSTLFNAISGFVPATGGVALDGVALQDLKPHQRAAAGLGRTFQNIGLARDQSVRQNILLAQHCFARYGDLAAIAYAGAAPRVETRLAQVAEDVIAGLGFQQYADTPVRQLSGGQQRLVELAAVLATGPKLLMLDEPTAGLSPAAAENLAERLRGLRDDRGQTILLIEHNVPLVLDLCDYVYVLSAGQLLAAGTTDELAAMPEILGAYLGGEVLA